MTSKKPKEELRGQTQRSIRESSQVKLKASSQNPKGSLREDLEVGWESFRLSYRGELRESLERTQRRA